MDPKRQGSGPQKAASPPGKSGLKLPSSFLCPSYPMQQWLERYHVLCSHWLCEKIALEVFIQYVQPDSKMPALCFSDFYFIFSHLKNKTVNKKYVWRLGIGWGWEEAQERTICAHLLYSYQQRWCFLPTVDFEDTCLRLPCWAHRELPSKLTD